MSDTARPSDKPSSGAGPPAHGPGWFRRLVRVELLGTVCVLLGLLAGYGYFFLDDHIEWAIEYAGWRALGAQVDVEELRTGWVRPSLTLEGLAVTDPDSPVRNWFEVDVLSARLNPDALLRAKLVVEDSRLRGLRFFTPRDRPGSVRESGGDARGLYDAAVNLVSSRLAGAASGTVLEDVLDLLSGKSSLDERWRALQGELEAPAALREVRGAAAEGRRTIEATLKTLPDRDTLRDLQDDIDALQGSSGTGAAGTVQRVRRVRRLAERLRRLRERVRTVRADLASTLDRLSDESDDLRDVVARDRRHLRERVSVEAFSVEGLSRDLFRGFVGRRAGSLATLLERVRPYLARGDAPAKPPAPDPSPGGRNYRFGGTTGYPGLWIQRFEASGTGDAGKGLALRARARHLSTAPLRAGKPMELSVSARPPEAIYDELEGGLRWVPAQEGRLRYDLQIRGWRIRDWKLLDRRGVTLALEDGTARLGLEGAYRPSAMSLRLGLQVRDPVPAVRGNASGVASLLRDAFAGMEVLDVRASAQGTPGELSWTVRSNLGAALERGLRGQLQRRASRLRAALEERYRREYASRVNEWRGRLDRDIQEARASVDERADLLEELRRSLDRTRGTPGMGLDAGSFP